MGRAQLSGTFWCKTLQWCPLLVQILNLCLDLQGSLSLPKTHKLHSYVIHFCKTNFISFKISLEIIKLLLHHLYLLQVFTHISHLNFSVVLLVFNPCSKFSSFTNQHICFNSLVELVLSLSGKSQQLIILSLDLVLSGCYGILISQVLLWCWQACFYFLHICSRHKTLTIIHFNFPPVLVVGVQKSKHISLFHGNFTRRLLCIIIQSHNTLLAWYIYDWCLLLSTRLCLFPQSWNGVAKCL